MPGLLESKGRKVVENLRIEVRHRGQTDGSGGVIQFIWRR